MARERRSPDTPGLLFLIEIRQGPQTMSSRTPTRKASESLRGLLALTTCPAVSGHDFKCRKDRLRIRGFSSCFRAARAEARFYFGDKLSARLKPALIQDSFDQTASGRSVDQTTSCRQGSQRLLILQIERVQFLNTSVPGCERAVIGREPIPGNANAVKVISGGTKP